MKNRSKFVAMITEMGFDINKPFDMTGSANENGCVWQNKSTHFGNRKVQTNSENEKSLAS